MTFGYASFSGPYTDPLVINSYGAAAHVSARQFNFIKLIPKR
jgi:hypothetical protein